MLLSLTMLTIGLGRHQDELEAAFKARDKAGAGWIGVNDWSEILSRSFRLG